MKTDLDKPMLYHLIKNTIKKLLLSFFLQTDNKTNYLMEDS